jgi:hypothetical protein
MNRIIHNEKNVSALFIKNNKLWRSGVGNGRRKKEEGNGGNK